MELLWTLLFGALCVGIGGLVIACDALTRAASGGPASVASNGGA